jgi:hypothetical protein
VCRERERYPVCLVSWWVGKIASVMVLEKEALMALVMNAIIYTHCWFLHETQSNL